MDLQLPMQSLPTAIYVVSFTPAYGEVYSVQQYAINFSYVVSICTWYFIMEPTGYLLILTVFLVVSIAGNYRTSNKQNCTTHRLD
jgi:hypothetical protein